MPAPKKPKAHKLDIFDTLAAIDRKDYEFLQRQPEDARKGFAAPVVLRWAGIVEGPNADMAILLTNEIANINFFDLYDHPELQYRLLCAAGLGRKQRHAWIAPPKVATTAPKVQKFVERYFPSASRAEINLIVSQLTSESLREFVNASGCTPQEAKEVIDAFDKKTGKGK